jgi:hypothetical protein
MDMKEGKHINFIVITNLIHRISKYVTNEQNNVQCNDSVTEGSAIMIVHKRTDRQQLAGYVEEITHTN